jgi:hypothetical protein
MSKEITNSSNWVEDGKDALIQISDTSANLAQLGNNLSDITGKIMDSVNSWKEMDFQMHQMDIQFNLFLTKVDFELSKYKERVPVVEKQLDFVNSQMGKMLDHVLAMDAKTEKEIDLKMRLLETTENYLDKLSGMMLKLL